MTSCVKPDKIVEMHCLYAKLGNYAAVGRQMGRSCSTMARYIKEDNAAAELWGIGPGEI